MAEPRSEVNPVDELAEEFARRWRAGERPSVEDYAERYPQWAEEIRAVLPAVVMMEEMKPRREDAVPAAPPASPERPPERVGEYRILREIGRGGMGVVYEAEQETLGRRVALKVMPGHLLANDRLRSRFRRESQAAARLHHTNIVPVFAVGERDGLCFYAMQLIRGRGLDRLIGDAAAGKSAGTDSTDATWPDGRPPASHPGPTLVRAGQSPQEFCRAVARIGAQVADALAHAHTQGILHRDVKPSNLLLDERGAVWVTDFGVAKLVEEANLTQSGDLVGTLKYMPPERFAGQSDARGDVYSLGITLYELLTLRSAFPDTTPHHLIQLITHEAPVRPRKLNPDVPPDLETIVLKAAARDPAQRYQTAGEMAEDLWRFLDDRPIVARRTGRGEQAWRWCRRNPALAGTTAAVFLLLMAVTVVSAVGYARTAAANRETAAALAAEKAQREQAENTSTLALEALNRTYERFAPTRLVATPQATGAEGVELPSQPALPPEAVPLLEDLLRTYEQIARSAGEFPRLRAQAAEANHRIGDLRQRLGRFEDAAGAYRTAIDLYAGLPPESAGDAVRIKLARACNELGRTLRWLQQVDEAAAMHERAVRTLAEAPPAFADRPEWRYELARSYYTLGQRNMLNSPHVLGTDRPRRPGEPGHGPPGPPGRDRPPGPPPNGEHPTARAAVLLEQLVHDFPAVPEYRHLLACCYRDMPPGGPGHGPPSRNAQADRAVDLLRQLVIDFPRVPDYRLDLCETLGRPGPPARPGEAGGDPRMRVMEAISLSEELRTLYPNVPEYTAAHARFLDTYGSVLGRGGDLAGAEQQHRKAVELQEKLVKQYPEVAAYRCWLSLMERSLARVLGQRGQWREARSRLESAAGRLEALATKEPRLGTVRPLLGTVYQDLAVVLNNSGETALAAEVLRKAEQYKPEGGPFPHDRPPPRMPPGRP